MKEPLDILQRLFGYHEWDKKSEEAEVLCTLIYGCFLLLSCVDCQQSVPTILGIQVVMN